MKKLLLLLGILYQTQAWSASPEKINLQNAIKMGVTESKLLKSSQAKILQYQSRVSQLRDLEIPSLKLSSGYTRLSNIDPFRVQFPGSPEPVTLFPIIVNNYTNKASLTGSIFNGFRWKYAMESAQLLEQAARVDADKDEADVALNIVNNYYTIYKIMQSQRLVDENMSQIDTHIKDITAFEKQGLATTNEVLKATLQKSNMELTKIDLTNSLKIATYNLGLLLGASNPANIEIDTTDLFRIRAINNIEDYMSQALGQRADVRSMDLKVKSVENSVKQSQSNYYPSLVAGANYYYSRPNQRVVPPTDAFKDTWDIGFMLSYDITALYSTKHVVAEAKANLTMQQAQQEQLTDAVKMEINQNYIQFNQAEEKVSVNNKAIVQAQENYRIMTAKYNNHIALLTDLLDANVTLLQTKINLANAKADAELAYQRLQKAIGKKIGE